MNRIIECPGLEYDIEMRGGLMFNIPKKPKALPLPITIEEKIENPKSPETQPNPESESSEPDSEEDFTDSIGELIHHPDLSKIMRNKIIKHLETLEVEELYIERYIGSLVSSLLKKKSMPKSIEIAKSYIFEEKIANSIPEDYFDKTNF